MNTALDSVFVVTTLEHDLRMTKLTKYLQFTAWISWINPKMPQHYLKPCLEYQKNFCRGVCKIPQHHHPSTDLLKMIVVYQFDVTILVIDTEFLSKRKNNKPLKCCMQFIVYFALIFLIFIFQVTQKNQGSLFYLDALIVSSQAV